MAKPFDVPTKQLIETNPADWLEFVGRPRAEVRIVDSYISRWLATEVAPDKTNVRLRGRVNESA